MYIIEVAQRFNETMRTGLHPGWYGWVMALGAMNMLVPLLFIKKTEARVTVAVILVQSAAMLLLFAGQGFTHLLGLAQFGWFWLIWYLWGRLDQHPSGTLFGKWMRAVLTMDAISLVLDVTGMVRYLLGDRAPWPI